MVEHVTAFAPRHCEMLGRDGTTCVVRYGVERAFNYGLTNRGPARLYLDLMFMFGSSFDTDPQLPWAAKALSSAGEQAARAGELHSQTLSYLEHVAGPDYLYGKEALQRARGISLESLRAAADVNLVSATLKVFRDVYPQKAAYVGDAALLRLIAKGTETAASHSMQGSVSVTVLAGLMFSMGHGITSDPQFPWVAATLNNEKIEGSSRRLERLFSKAQTYLAAVLEYLARN